MSASDLGWISTVIPKGFIHLSAQFGPTIAGLVVILLGGRGKGILIILKNLINFNHKLKWYFFALLFELILFVLVVLVSVLLRIVHVETSSELLLSSFTKFIMSTIYLTLLTGLGEEIGWRGFLLPKLQSSLPVLIASVVMTLIVSFWYLRTNDLTTLLSGDWHGFLISFMPDMEIGRAHV
jgi:membrane protease YdiL (CAAX protease family)